MKITVIGAGYVGLVTGLCLTKFGHQVWFLENNAEKIFSLKNGKLPLVEPGLDLLFKQATKGKKIFFSRSYPSVINKTDIWFVCVGTPSLKDGSWSLAYVLEAIKTILKFKKPRKKGILVIKSTIDPNRVFQLNKLVAQDRNVTFAIMPEFLREGSAVEDFLNPTRLVVGIEDKEALSKLLKLHRKIRGRRIICSPVEAALIKVLSNVFLPMKISFANLAACYCEKLKADICQVIEAVGLDPRIGKSYLGAGLGFGGSCFPKDTRGIIVSLRRLKISPLLFKSVLKINDQMVKLMRQKIKKCFKNKFNNKIVVLWGLTFKPNTDDIRESKSIQLLDYLSCLGFKELRACDPLVGKVVKKMYPQVKYFQNPYQSARNVDGVILATEWDLFKKVNFKKLARLVRQKIVFDGRNILDKIKLEKIGFKYYGIGR